MANPSMGMIRQTVALTPRLPMDPGVNSRHGEKTLLQEEMSDGRDEARWSRRRG